MLLKWKTNGQLKLDCTELYAQYSQNVAHLYVLTDVLNKNDGQMFAQFGKWDNATMQYETLTDENRKPKIYTMGWKVLEKSDGETPSWLYDCYIPAELLTFKGAVCVTLKFQQNGQTGNPDNPTAVFATGNLGFNIEQNLPTGQIVPSDSELAALIAKVNALELNSMTAANTTAYAETLAPTSEATVSIISTTDSSGQKHFVFNFGIPQGIKGDSGINSALLSNEDGDSDENGFTQQFINNKFDIVNTKIDGLLSNDDGDSEMLGYTQSAVNRIANAKVINSAGTSETQAYSQAAANATFSNPNLLINPDFRINQRNIQVATATNQFIADRWQVIVSGEIGGGSISRINNGIKIQTTNDAYVNIQQYFEDSDIESLKGKTVTFSANIIENTNINGYCYCQLWVDDTNYLITTKENGVISKTVTIPKTVKAMWLQIMEHDDSGVGGSFVIEWVKLEVGSVATLFIVPLISGELSKCQRYYQEIEVLTRVPCCLLQPDRIDFTLFLPTTLRTNPTVNASSVVIQELGGAVVSGFTTTVDAMKNNIRIVATKLNHEIINNASLIVVNSPITIDAEIY